MADMFDAMTRSWKWRNRNEDDNTDGEHSEIEQARRMLMEDSEDDSDQLKIRAMERLKDATKKHSPHNFNQLKQLRYWQEEEGGLGYWVGHGPQFQPADEWAVSDDDSGK